MLIQFVLDDHLGPQTFRWCCKLIPTMNSTNEIPSECQLFSLIIQFFFHNLEPLTCGHQSHQMCFIGLYHGSKWVKQQSRWPIDIIPGTKVKYNQRHLMTSVFLTLTNGQGLTTRSKVIDVQVSAFSERFLLPLKFKNSRRHRHSKKINIETILLPLILSVNMIKGERIIRF